MKLVAVGREVPHEKSIADLMIPASAYQRVYEDEPLQRVIEVLTQSLFPAMPGKRTRQGHRSILVYGREGSFLGCIRLNDILDLLISPSRMEAYAPFEPGMFVARCNQLVGITAGEILGEQRFVDIEAPLMEAVQLMVVDGLINVPVLEEGNLVGVLTDRNVLLEICNIATGGASIGHKSIVDEPSRDSSRSRWSEDLEARQAPPFRAGKDSAGSRSEPMSDGAATRDSSRKRPTAGHAGSNACGDTSSAARHSAQEPTVSAGQDGARRLAGISGLQAGEDVKKEAAPKPRPALLDGAGRHAPW